MNATVLQRYGGGGDHRVFIVDFTLDSILGSMFLRVVSPGGRKLHCESEQIRGNYTRVLHKLANRHQLFKKLNELDKITGVVS